MRTRKGDYTLTAIKIYSESMVIKIVWYLSRKKPQKINRTGFRVQ